MQEPQFSPFESDTLTPAERQALKQARGRRLRALLCCVGVGALTLFAVGCPEPADLQNPNAFPLPPNATAGSGTTGGSGTSGSGSTGVECEVACMATALTSCKTCHSKMIQLVPKLDLQTAGYTALLKNQPAQYTGLTPAMCTAGGKLIDTAAPANSWLLKKVKNDVGMCGTVMPPMGTMPATTPADIKCFEDYVACVSGAAPAATGGTGSGAGGTASAGTATGGSGGTGGA